MLFLILSSIESIPLAKHYEITQTFCGDAQTAVHLGEDLQQRINSLSIFKATHFGW